MRTYVRLAYPQYIREKAREMRTSKQLTIDEIAERLAICRTTIYYWVGDIPIPRTVDQALAQRRASRATRTKARAHREEAYEQGRTEFESLCRDPTFRDFVCLYIAEGYRRDRNSVAIGNSSPTVMRISNRWITHFGRNKIDYRVHHHADQNPEELARFWGGELGIGPYRDPLRQEEELRPVGESNLAVHPWRDGDQDRRHAVPRSPRGLDGLLA